MRIVDEIGMSAQSFATRAVIWALAKSGDPLATAASSTMGNDPYRVYASIRERGPLVPSRLGPLVSSSYSVASSVLRDPRFGLRSKDTPAPTKRQSGVFDWPQRPRDVVPPIAESILALDPPDHTRLRRLAAPPFKTAALATRLASIEKTAQTLINGLDKRETFDLVGEFAAPLPVLTICDVLGIDGEDHKRFARWGTAIGNSLGGASGIRDVRAARSALLDLNAFFDKLIASRRRDPTDDIVGELVLARDDGDRLTDRELKASCLLLFLAGFETMVNLVGNGVRALLDNPEQWALLTDRPALSADAVEELLRFDPPVQLTTRVAHEDADIAGTPTPKGTMITISLGGANRDPEVFTRPDELDITRENARNHLGFSSGLHYCLGATLARMQSEVAFRTLAERLPDLTPAGNPVQVRSRSMRGLLNLPVRRRTSY
jgi:P450-derived glycosyltransferase activator